MKSLSLVMITKNEESKLKRCLDSVKGIVDEIIVVDTGSTDTTKDIALTSGAKVYDYKWNNNFSDARNYAINKSSGDWNLILDADEFISDVNLNSVRKFINSTDEAIGQVKIINLFEQDGEIKKSSSFISRLAPRDVLFNGSIHEQLDINYPRYKIDIVLEHDGYLNTNKFERNISLILSELKEKPNDSYLLYQASKTYYVNQMYDDASHYFSVFYNNLDYKHDAFAKDGIVLYLYNTIKTKDFSKGLKIIDDTLDIMNDYCDFYFVCGVFFTELVAYNPKKYMSYFDNIELSYLNALNLGESDDYNTVEGTGSYLAAFNLGVYYELIGNISKALNYYKISFSYNYAPALKRLNKLSI